MPSLDELEQTVDELDENTSPVGDFRNAYRQIEEVARNATTMAEISRIQNILNTFRGKLPDLIQVKRIRADARDLHTNLALNSVQQTINSIARRNQAISALKAKLAEQSQGAVNDANLLNQIKDALDKANKTIQTVKGLVDQLTEADGNAKATLKALIDAVGNVSTIFS